MWDVWEPDDIKRMSWDCVMLLTVVYLVIVTPYLIAFDISTVSGGLFRSCRVQQDDSIYTVHHHDLSCFVQQYNKICAGDICCCCFCPMFPAFPSPPFSCIPTSE